MIRSMTAFAREERQGDWGTLSLELRSVNHRYLEVTVRAPEEIRALEAKLRERIGQALKRGKVDCNIRYQPPAELPGELEINRDLVAGLAHVSREVDTLLYNPAPVNSLEVLRWPGVLQMPTPDPERVQGEVLAAVDAALADLVATREREGEKLKSVILQRCDAMQPIVAQVREHLPEILERLRERLRERLAELKVDVDEGRLEQELVLQTQRMDVDEELDRLDTHLAEVRRVLEREEPVGRRLDFLMQELNREANTLASKSADVDNTRCAVDLKVLIEQMREQVQNIE
jgi:uncharacterized protein (TIGR00255 family)